MRSATIEAGAKFDLLQVNLSGMISLYQLTRSNVTTSDPDFPMFPRFGKAAQQGRRS
jgi:hypothetical protein